MFRFDSISPCLVVTFTPHGYNHHLEFCTNWIDNRDGTLEMVVSIRFAATSRHLQWDTYTLYILYMKNQGILVWMVADTSSVCCCCCFLIDATAWLIQPIFACVLCIYKTFPRIVLNEAINDGIAMATTVPISMLRMLNFSLEMEYYVRRIGMNEWMNECRK